MKLIIGAICEGDTINLQGDHLIDPDGDNKAFERPVYVHQVYDGRPRRSDEISGLEAIELEDENPSEQGITIIVAWTSSRPATLIYFPNDHYEVEVVYDDETDDDEDDDEDEDD